MAGLLFRENYGCSTSSPSPGHRSPWPSRVGCLALAILPSGDSLVGWACSGAPTDLVGLSATQRSGLSLPIPAGCSSPLLGLRPALHLSTCPDPLLLPSPFTGVTPQQTHCTATTILATSPQSPKLTAGVQMALAPTQSLLKLQKQGRNTRE